MKNDSDLELVESAMVDSLPRESKKISPNKSKVEEKEREKALIEQF